MNNRRRYVLLVLSLVITLCLLILFCICVGRYSINPLDVFGAVRSYVGGESGNEAMENVLFFIRIPRILCAILVGASLSVSGACYQSIFRNPLISPDILGVSSGACVGAAIAILMGYNGASLQILAFLGGMLAVLLTTSLPKFIRNSSNMMVVLSGIIVGGFLTSVLGVLKFISDDQTQLASIVFWQMGSLSRVNWGSFMSISLPILVALGVLILLAWRINILSFGEEEALTVGVNVRLIRGISIVCASLLTASAVSTSGTIGWIGLVIPHFGRLLCGSDNTKLFPVTAIVGACFLLLIDAFARTITSLEIPLSILCGLLGAPFYIWLLSRKRVNIT